MKKVNNDLSSWLIKVMKYTVYLISIFIFSLLSCKENEDFTPIEKNTMIEILKEMQLKSASIDIAKPIIPDSLAMLVGHLATKKILNEYNVDSTMFTKSITYYLKDKETMHEMFLIITTDFEHKLEKLKNSRAKID